MENKSWKMKLAGYVFLLVGLASGVFAFLKFDLIESEMAFSVCKFLVGSGITLLTINAGKKITGELAKTKQETMKKE